MKITNSNTEENFRLALRRSHSELFKDPAKKRLLDTLRLNFPEMVTAYTLNWTPEQGEEIYLILIDNHTISKVEIDNLDKSVTPSLLSFSVTEYKRGLSKLGQVQLAVALDLANSELQ
jgi:hypothetical protein